MTRTAIASSIFLLLTHIPATMAADAPTYDAASRVVSNWKEQSVAHLGVAESDLAKHKFLRCIKLNNYWCLKDMGWNGRLGRDADNHTAFVNGEMAARAAVRNFRTAYSTRGRKTAFQIMSVYAPPDDCNGSKAGTRPDGTCIWGKNPTETYAKKVAEGVADSSDTDLLLFDAQGRADVRKRPLTAPRATT